MSKANFWMVWNPKGRPPTFPHTSRADADTEAARLAELCPGQQFVVLKAMGGFEVPKTQAKKMKMSAFVGNFIPF